MNWSINNGQAVTEPGNQVFVDGQMMNYARWPTSSLDISRPTYAVAATASYVTNSSGYPYTGTFTATGLSGFATNYWQGASIVYMMAYWENYGIVTASSSSGSVTFNTNWIPTAGEPFYLVAAAPQAITGPGEWYLNPTTHTLYLWTPTGDSPANHVVEAKSRDNAFDLSRRSYIDIQGLSVFSSTIVTSSSSTYDVINGIAASYVSEYILDWGGEQQENTGIVLRGSYDTIENSVVAYSSGNGVLLEGDYNTATNNVIHDVDYLPEYCAAVDTGSTSNFSTISYNTLFTSGRYLILMDGMQNGSVVHNNVYDSMLQTWDGGCINCSGGSHGGTVIAYNTVHDSQDPNGDAVGIYLDNSSADFVVADNLVYDCNYAMIVNFPSSDILVYNNTLTNCPISIHCAGSPQTLTGDVFENNIYTGTISYTSYPSSGYTASNNLSTTANNAKFVNLALLNYLLQSGSPARNAGLVISPYTNDYTDPTPDLGCFQYGLTPWTAGTSAATNVFVGLIPATPLNLTATSKTAEIDLAWQNSATTSTRVVVERSTNGLAFTPIVYLPGNATTYADTTLPTGSYYYRVRVDNGAYSSGCSNYPGPVSVTVSNGGSAAAAAPTGATAVAASGTAINVSWTDNSTTEAGFKIERSTDDESFIQIGVVGANVTTFQDTGVTVGTTYYYRVCAFNANYGNSAYSNVANAVGQALALYETGGAGVGNVGVSEAIVAASSPAVSGGAAPATVAATPVEVASHDSVFSGPKATTVAATPSVALSAATETVRAAELGGIVLPSAPLSKPTTGKELLLLPQPTLLSGVSTATQRKIASLIDAAPAAPSASSVAAVVVPTPGSSLARAVTVRRVKSTPAPAKGAGLRLLTPALTGISSQETDEPPTVKR
jgi:hypothetical protein